MNLDQSTSEIILHYISILKRGKYFLILPVVASLIIGSAVAFKLPPVYRSSAKLFYVEAQIPEWAKLQLINIYLEAMFLYVENTAFSGENCMNAIKELNLFPELINKVPMSDLITSMRENFHSQPIYTQVQSKTGTGRAEDIVTGVEFYYEYKDPKKAFQVANLIATNYIEYFKKFREGFATSTSGFFSDERERLREEISLIDQKIAEFKEKNVNELPDLFALNYGMSDRLNAKLASVDLQIQTLNGEKRGLEAQLATMNPFIAMQGISGERIISPKEQYETSKAELGVLLARYSEKHPDIIRLRHEIDLLEKQLGEQEANKLTPKNTGENQTDSKPVDYDFTGAYNPAYVNLMTQLDQLNIEIEKQKKEKEEAYNEMLKYEGRVAKTPMVEKEFRILDRDLESAKKRYDDLVSQVLTIESASAMEKREMGGKLSLAQPPSFPLKPERPNRPLIILGSFVIGLFLGTLTLLGWDFLTQTIRTPQDVSIIAAEIPVLSVLPMLTPKKQRMFSIKKLAGPISFGIIIILLFLIDAFYMNIDILFVMIFSAIKTKILLLGF